MISDCMLREAKAARSFVFSAVEYARDVRIKKNREDSDYEASWS